MINLSSCRYESGEHKPSRDLQWGATIVPQGGGKVTLCLLEDARGCLQILVLSYPCSRNYLRKLGISFQKPTVVKTRKLILEHGELGIIEQATILFYLFFFFQATILEHRVQTSRLWAEPDLQAYFVLQSTSSSSNALGCCPCYQHFFLPRPFKAFGFVLESAPSY